MWFGRPSVRIIMAGTLVDLGAFSKSLKPSRMPCHRFVAPLALILSMFSVALDLFASDMDNSLCTIIDLAPNVTIPRRSRESIVSMIVLAACLTRSSTERPVDSDSPGMMASEAMLPETSITRTMSQGTWGGGFEPSAGRPGTRGGCISTRSASWAGIGCSLRLS